MAVVEKYSLGTPCWFELGTTDQTAAKQFYSQLLGWSSKDDPMGPDEFYTMFQLNGHDTGAAYTLPARLVAQGVGPHWNVYFAAPDVDLSAARVSGLGGVVVQPPFDVPDAGRMAICQDPGGASFSLWQARRNPGAAVIDVNPDHIPMARPRSCSGKLALINARLPGTSIAAPIPCTALATISSPMSGENPQ